MTRSEHLLAILAEECAEVAQRSTKALRFGLEEIQPGQDKNNAERIRGELADLLAVHDMLMAEHPGVVRSPSSDEIFLKKEKVEKYLEYSHRLGLLDE